MEERFSWTRRRWLATSAGIIGVSMFGARVVGSDGNYGRIGAGAKAGHGGNKLKDNTTVLDAVVIGGGPSGLSAALALGRGMKTVKVLDAGVPRNARATGMMNFVSRDGIAPTEFRRIAGEELARYGIAVESRRVVAVDGVSGRFEVRSSDSAGREEVVVGRRVMLGVGMVDEAVPIPGAERFWGHHIFQCPFCHGWEHKGQPWGVLADSLAMLEHAAFFLSWTPVVTAFVGDLVVPDELVARLEAKGVRVKRGAITRAVGRGDTMVGLEVGGEVVPCEGLIARPPQRQTELVKALGLELDQAGFVKVDAFRQTSREGIYAAGDLCTQMQSALGAAAAGQFAGAAICAVLTA